MGILNGKPKAPPVQPITLPPVVAAPTIPTEPIKTDEQIAAESRTDSLLRRSRSRFGTIFTGFKGFLSQSEKSESAGRKTLLGE